MDFGRLRIAFDDRVLRPRPWTAAQSAWAAEILATAPAGPVLELCSGAGQIGLLAVADIDRRLVCVDLDPVACDYARRNAAAAGHGRPGRGPRGADRRGGARRRAVRRRDRRPAVGAPRRDRPLPRGPAAGDRRRRRRHGRRLDLRRHAPGCTSLPGGSLLLQLGTVEQVDAVRERLRGDELSVTEVRWHERGVLVRIDRD